MFDWVLGGSSGSGDRLLQIISSSAPVMSRLPYCMAGLSSCIQRHGWASFRACPVPQWKRQIQRRRPL